METRALKLPLLFLLLFPLLFMPVAPGGAAWLGLEGSSSVPVPPFVFLEPAQVIRVIDGDTFIARWENGHKERIRPAGVDAPELSGHECFAVEATVWASNFLLLRWIWLSPVEQPRDRYGRVLGKVYLDSSRTADFGRIMVSQGFAEAMEQYPTGQELQPLEEEAREAKRGMWGSCPYEDP
jgi:endonuclease YncB( thermonuclease family)